MKHILTTIFSFFIFAGVFAQTQSDFYFKKPLPDKCQPITKIHSSFFGEWQSTKDTLRSFIISENKIISQYKHLMIIPKKDFTRLGYTLKDDFVYGFSDTDSIPGTMKDDTVIFCYINDHLLVDLTVESDDVFLSSLGGGLVLSRKADSLYTYSFISVKDDKLLISDTDHDPVLNEIKKLFSPEEIKNEDKETVLYLADPDKKKMEKFILSGFFNQIQNCKRIGNL